MLHFLEKRIRKTKLSTKQVLKQGVLKQHHISHGTNQYFLKD